MNIVKIQQLNHIKDNRLRYKLRVLVGNYFVKVSLDMYKYSDYLSTLFSNLDVPNRDNREFTWQILNKNER